VAQGCRCGFSSLSALPGRAQRGVDCWKVDIGAFRLSFVPRGTLIVGARGRVDIKSSQPGVPVLKLIADEGESGDDHWLWAIYCDEAKMEGLELNPENLAQALDLLMPEG
jgi:hypothetical protein